MCGKRFLGFFFVYLSVGVLFPSFLFSQDLGRTDASTTSQISIEQTAKNSRESATRLLERLEARKLQVEAQVIYYQNIAELSKSESEKDKKHSQESDAKLKKAEAELEKLRKELKEISNLQEASSEMQSKLNLGFEKYQKKAESIISELKLSNNILICVSVVSIVTAAISIISR